MWRNRPMGKRDYETGKSRFIIPPPYKEKKVVAEWGWIDTIPFLHSAGSPAG